MAKWHVAPLRFVPAFRALEVCEHSWLRYNNKLYNINCTKCRVSFLYELSGFIFVRNVWFRFCTKCLVLVFVRDVVCTECRVYELSCPLNWHQGHHFGQFCNIWHLIWNFCLFGRYFFIYWSHSIILHQNIWCYVVFERGFLLFHFIHYLNTWDTAIFRKDWGLFFRGTFFTHKINIRKIC